MSTLTRLGRRVVVWALVIIVVLIAALPPAHSQDPVLQKIESDNALIAREGTWLSQPVSAASGGSYLYNAPNEPAVLSLSFSGPSVEIVYIAGPTLGTLAIEVDGVVLRTVLTTASEVAYGQSAKIDYLTEEDHTLRVYAQAGGVVGVDAIAARLPLPSSRVETTQADTRATPPCDQSSFIRRMTDGYDGTQSNGYINGLDMTPDGRYVAFMSDASNLVEGVNPTASVYMYRLDALTCNIEAVAMMASDFIYWGPYPIQEYEPSISNDGRYVGFVSMINLVPSDTNNLQDAYIHDMHTGENILISRNAAGEPGNGISRLDDISGDGRYVTFESSSTNLDPADTSPDTDAFLLDRVTNQVTCVSVQTGGAQAQANVIEVEVSDDGRIVVYQSGDSTLVPDDSNGVHDIFITDRETLTTTWISTRPGGNSGFKVDPDISSDARYVSFWATDTNIVPGDTNGAVDIFLYDRITDQTRIVSNSSTGGPANGSSIISNISNNGRYVVFTSSASNLVPGDLNNAPDVFLVDLLLNTTVRVSQTLSGGAVAGEIDSWRSCDVSDDGRFVIFGSWGTNIIVPDHNNQIDLFLVDYQGHLPHSVLTATAPDATQVNLNWTQQAPTPTDFEVQRSPDGSTNWTVVTTTTTGQTSYVDLAVTPSTSYYYRLHALTPDPNYTAYSNISYVVVPALREHTILASNIPGIGQVDLTWSQFSPTPTGFEVQRSTDGSNWTPLGTTLVGQTSYADSSVACGTIYSYRLRVLTLDPNYLQFSNSRYVTTLTCPNDTLALINPNTRQISLINTLAVNPPPTAYTTYTINARASGQWVMGDWDGDDVETPGVYEDSGAFMFTNDLGPTATWSGIWFGLLGKPPVAGRFDASINHDCLGVVDSAEFPPYGTGYAVYFTCNLTSGPIPPLASQWLSIPFFADGASHGKVQFEAGDWDADGVDSMVLRRDETILYTNQPLQTQIPASLSLLRFQFPSLPPDDYGVLVAGDWNNDGADSFGLMFQSGDFVYQYGPSWTSAIYVQHTGSPVGTPIQAASWR